MGGKQQPNYNPIRSLGRGLEVLQTVNREGPVSLMEICNITQLPYPTVFRIIFTLIESGYVEREHSRKRYRATLLTKSLSSGFQDDSELVRAARRHIQDLTDRLAWPISISTRVGNMMMVRDSTHTMTSLTLNNYAPGYTLPLAECSAGKVHLAFCEEQERQNIRQGFELLGNGADRMGLLLIDNGSLLDEIKSNGYATQARNAYTKNPGKTSAIAVPVLKDGVIHGSISIIFFAVGMKMAQAEIKYISELKAAAEKIAADLPTDSSSPAL